MCTKTFQFEKSIPSKNLLNKGKGNKSFEEMKRDGQIDSKVSKLTSQNVSKWNGLLSQKNFDWNKDFQEDFKNDYCIVITNEGIFGLDSMKMPISCSLSQPYSKFKVESLFPRSSLDSSNLLNSFHQPSSHNQPQLSKKGEGRAISDLKYGFCSSSSSEKSTELFENSPTIEKMTSQKNSPLFTQVRGNSSNSRGTVK